MAAGLVGSATSAATPRSAPIVFPLLGDFPIDDNYGDARANGSHAGIDTMAPRRTPVLAAEDGRIKWWTTSARAGCMLYLYGRSGTTYLYIHLNNDRTLGNDNQAGCVAELTYSVADGANVTAGQQIALNGDSGDADGNPHLHFEVHPGGGGDVNPFPYLRDAERLLFPGRIGARFTIGLRGVPIAAGGGTLTLRASAVRWWPGGRWTAIAAREVELAIGKGAAVDATIAKALESPTQRALQGRSAEPQVTAFTVPAPLTAEAMRGLPGALVVGRLTRPGGGATVVASPTTPLPELGDTDGPGRRASIELHRARSRLLGVVGRGTAGV